MSDSSSSNDDDDVAAPPPTQTPAQTNQLTAEHAMTALMQAFYVEAQEWTGRSFELSVECERSSVPPSIDEATPFTSARTLTPAERARTFNYEFVPNSIECSAYASNPQLFPLGLTMARTAPSNDFLSPSPLIALVYVGSTTAAIQTTSEQLCSVWRNIARQHITTRRAQRLRLIACALRFDRLNVGGDANLRRGLVALELNLSVVVECTPQGPRFHSMHHALKTQRELPTVARHRSEDEWTE